MPFCAHQEVGIEHCNATWPILTSRKWHGISLRSDERSYDSHFPNDA